MTNDHNTHHLLRSAALIARLIKDDITPQEAEELEVWLRSDVRNREILEEMKDEQRRKTAWQQMRTFDIETALLSSLQRMEENEHRIKSRRRITALQIAASISLLVGLSLFLYYILPINNSQKTDGIKVMPSKYTSDIPAGSKKAMLLLDDGSSVELGSTKDTSFTSKTNHFNQHNGSLSYVSESSNDPILLHSLITPKGGEYHLQLDDGTNVWLNAGSSIRFPSRFTRKQRKVSVTGEVFFDIAKNAESPFIVEVNNTEIHVMGTAFNIRSYPGDNKTQTTLVSGRISIQASGRSKTINPGLTATVADDGHIQITDADVEAITAWKQGLFIFRAADLPTIMDQISRWYDVQIKYALGLSPSSNFNGKVNARIGRHLPISKLLEIIEYTEVAKFEINNNIVTVLPYK